MSGDRSALTRAPLRVEPPVTWPDVERRAATRGRSRHASAVFGTNAVVGLAVITCAIFCGGCSAPEAALLVAVRSDLVTGSEVVAIECELDRSTRVRTFAGGMDLLDAPSVCVFGGLSEGRHELDVALLDAFGRRVLARPLQVVVRGRTVVTIPLGRDCASVTCPDASDASATACLGGRCVSPECAEETTLECDAPRCERADDCPAVPSACGTRACISGACFIDGRDACAAGLVCDPDVGCVVAGTHDCPDAGAALDASAPDGSAPDAGTVDGGVCDALLCETFEAPLNAAWTEVSDGDGVAGRAAAAARTGMFGYSARATTFSGAIARYAFTEPLMAGEVSVQAAVRVPSVASLEDYAVLLELAGDGGKVSLDLGPDTQTQIAINPPVGAPNWLALPPLPRDTWVCVRLQVVLDAGSSGAVRVHYDDVLVGESARDITTAPAEGWPWLHLGASVGGNTMTIQADFDDLVVSRAPITCAR